MKKILCIIIDHNKPEMTKIAFTAAGENKHPDLKLSVLIINNGEKYNENLLSYYKKNSALVLEIENKGFANGVNHGLKNQEFDYYWLLNNDAVPYPNALENLIGSAEQDVAGIASSMLLNPDGSYQGGGGGQSRFFLYKSIKIPADNASHVVYMVYGASMLIQKKVIEKIGLFDEKFFMYCEENDYCIRANKAGIKIICATSSKVVHEMGGSIGQGSMLQKLYFMRNIMLLHKKHSGQFTIIFNFIYHSIRILTSSRFVGIRFKALKYLISGLNGSSGKIAL